MPRLLWLALATAGIISGQQRGIVLADLTWVEAEKALRPETVVVIPIGAESKEHGPHLKLKTDYLQAEYYQRQILERADVVVAPTLNYGFYPAFTEYPGSTTLRLETARDMLVDICRGLARYGPKRFYALNTGVSTLRALAPAAQILAEEGILLRYTDILEVGAEAEKQVKKEEGRDARRRDRDVADALYRSEFGGYAPGCERLPSVGERRTDARSAQAWGVLGQRNLRRRDAGYAGEGRGSGAGDGGGDAAGN